MFATLEAGVTQDLIGYPSKWTVQAPHRATPQPNLVPVKPITSRKTQSSGMSSGTSTCCFLPLISSVSIGSPYDDEGYRDRLRVPTGSETARPAIMRAHIAAACTGWPFRNLDRGAGASNVKNAEIWARGSGTAALPSPPLARGRLPRFEHFAEEPVAADQTRKKARRIWSRSLNPVWRATISMG